MTQCEVLESALTLSEAESMADKETKELEKIRRTKLQLEGQRMTENFSPEEDLERQVLSPLSKRGQRARMMTTPQHRGEDTPPVLSVRGK